MQSSSQKQKKNYHLKCIDCHLGFVKASSANHGMFNPLLVHQSTWMTQSSSVFHGCVGWYGQTVSIFCTFERYHQAPGAVWVMWCVCSPWAIALVHGRRDPKRTVTSNWNWRLIIMIQLVISYETNYFHSLYIRLILESQVCLGMAPAPVTTQ